MCNNLMLDAIVSKNLKRYLIKGNFGLEKENCRVNNSGELSLTKHPKELGNKTSNPYIKTDFSESQVEMITPVCDSIEEVYDFMENLNKIVSLELKDEYLWPQSNPPILPKDEAIPVAQYDDGESTEYREYLAKKYGKRKQMLCGVHYNFSFKEEFIKTLYKEMKLETSYKEFKDGIYFKIARDIIKYSYIFVYLTGASPVFHKSYTKKCSGSGSKLTEEDYYLKDIVSLRNSKCGYKNKENFCVSYSNAKDYVDSINKLISKGSLISAKEYYNPVRIKALGKGNILDNIVNNGVDYLEIRFLDLNPLTPFGIDKDALYLIHGFIIYSLLRKDEELKCSDIREAYINNELVAARGREENLRVFIQGNEISFKENALNIINDMTSVLSNVIDNMEPFTKAFEKYKDMINSHQNTTSEIMIEEMKKSSFVKYTMNIAKNNYDLVRGKGYTLKGYEDLELSTQILIIEAIKNGIEFNVMDRGENFISLKKGDKIEYIKQATKTSVDSYITALIMENKLITKELLLKANIRVPMGKNYDSVEEAKLDYDYFKGNHIVVKPKSTNFGIGISIFTGEYNQEDYNRAVEIAFENDNSILIEEFIEGKEYRFLVIDNKVVGILHRVPANVCGDGIKSIKELVDIKNQDPLRGKGYKTPLEKIKLGEIEEMFLKAQGKNFDYIPNKDEIIYLRENSNISTGGDSIDFTDDIHESYKEIAIKSAKAVGAVITGVDVMIKNIKEEATVDNYGIIELNFNPAIHIHCFPYRGENRRVGEKLLELLFRD